MTTYCATGHRPNKLGGYSDAALDKLTRIAHGFLSMDRPDEFISGMALGWDTACALAALGLGIPLVAAVPFLGQEEAWPDASKFLYREILQRAQVIEIVSSGGYSAKAMQVRNVWMVDHSDRVIAMYDGSPGGTRNCIYDAEFKRRPVVNLWPHFISAE